MAKPTVSITSGACRASVFEFEGDRNGTKYTLKRIAFNKRYKDKNGEWKDTHWLDVNDVPKAIVALTKVYEHLTTKVEKASEGGAANGP